MATGNLKLSVLSRQLIKEPMGGLHQPIFRSRRWYLVRPSWWSSAHHLAFRQSARSGEHTAGCLRDGNSLLRLGYRSVLWRGRSSDLR